MFVKVVQPLPAEWGKVLSLSVTLVIIRRRKWQTHIGVVIWHPMNVLRIHVCNGKKGCRVVNEACLLLRFQAIFIR